jgi:2-hydroxychromene-2-carboxylate isomerase
MRWVFDRSVNPKQALANAAALSGMPRDRFDRVLADDGLKAAILARSANAERKYDFGAMPTFVINNKAHNGEMSFDEFEKFVGA